jgi:hypothetical protein
VVLAWGEGQDHKANFEILKKVLQTKCVTYSPSDLSWGPVRHEVNWDRSVLEEELVVPTITCYADIPKDALKVHMKKYGYFGISFDRQYLVRFHTRPVTYIPMYSGDEPGISGRSLIKDIEASVKGFYKFYLKERGESQKEYSRCFGSAPKDANEAVAVLKSTLLKDFIGFIKPFDSELADSDPDNYYMEREWRKLGNIRFDDSVVRTIVIARDYVEDLLKEFPQYEFKLKIVDEDI